MVCVCVCVCVCVSSTLPSLDSPYPMLVLTGPQACGKRELAHKLCLDFTDFFSYGSVHTLLLGQDHRLNTTVLYCTLKYPAVITVRYCRLKHGWMQYTVCVWVCVCVLILLFFLFHVSLRTFIWSFLSLRACHTTRDPYFGEENGSDYHFVTEEVFQNMLYMVGQLSHQ